MAGTKTPSLRIEIGLVRPQDARHIIAARGHDVNAKTHAICLYDRQIVRPLWELYTIITGDSLQTPAGARIKQLQVRYAMPATRPHCQLP